MRSDRRRELLEQMEREEKEIRQEKFFKFTRVISVIYAVLLVALFVVLFMLKVIPTSYLVMGGIVMAFVSLFVVPVLFSYHGKKGRKIVALIVAILMLGVFGAGIYYVSNTMGFIDEITKEEIPTEDYYVLVKAGTAPTEEEIEAYRKENGKDADLHGMGYQYVDISDISGEMLGSLLTNDARYSEAKAELQNIVDVTYDYAESQEVLYDRLVKEQPEGETRYRAIFMSAALYQSGKAENWENIETETQILYTVKLPIEVVSTIDQVDVSKESFNIYVSGTDLDGYRSDVNMIATVNPVTHKVLITSIPRDYYVYLPSKEAKDKLTHSSIYGVEETVAAVEETLGININYYVRVNYTALKSVVDAIGGIDVESEYTFTTSGMGSLNGHYFVKGTNHLDGDAALAFSRERHSFPAGDMQRNINQQLVLEAIIKKATSSTTIMKSYSSLLEAVGSNMKTNMTTTEMSDIVKLQVSEMPSWDIERQSIKGENGYDLCYALGFKAAVVNRIPEEEAKALDEIVKVSIGQATDTE